MSGTLKAAWCPWNSIVEHEDRKIMDLETFPTSICNWVNIENHIRKPQIQKKQKNTHTHNNNIIILNTI